MAPSRHDALSPRVMLASAIHAQPGVYALLLGSGVSRSAGISTGWEIVKELLLQAAVADAPEDRESHDLAQSDPEAWWSQHGEGDLGYSSLLASFAPSSAARQGLLAKYFVPSETDREDGLKGPTAAHVAIAELAKTKHIKIIVTTNFDRLVEQALTAATVPHQVITRAEQVPASQPVGHDIVTVIKLHGDWTDLESRNTIDELDEYPPEWDAQLKQVFNEYGLVVSGWSADWDNALVRALESTPRRYPLYWDSRSSRGEVAQGILARLDGHVIKAETADHLFTSLRSSVDAISLLAEPPLETAVAITKLKRALADPLRRIELHDLIFDKVQQVRSSLIEAVTAAGQQLDADEFIEEMVKASRPLLSLLLHGIRYDDGAHRQLWFNVLEALMDARRNVLHLPAHDNLQHFPALLALRAMGIEAVALGQDDLLIELLTKPRWKNRLNRFGATTPAGVLHLNAVLDANLVRNLATLNGFPAAFPASHLLKVLLEDLFREYGVEDAVYRELCDDVEYRTALLQSVLSGPEVQFGGPNLAEFMHHNAWEVARPPVGDGWVDVPAAENRFREELERDLTARTSWTDYFGDERPIEEVIENLRATARKFWY